MFIKRNEQQYSKQVALICFHNTFSEKHILRGSWQEGRLMLIPRWVTLSRHRPQASHFLFWFWAPLVFAQWGLHVGTAGKRKLFGLQLRFTCSFEHLALF